MEPIYIHLPPAKLLSKWSRHSAILGHFSPGTSRDGIALSQTSHLAEAGILFCHDGWGTNMAWWITLRGRVMVGHLCWDWPQVTTLIMGLASSGSSHGAAGFQWQLLWWGWPSVTTPMLGLATSSISNITGRGWQLPWWGWTSPAAPMVGLATSGNSHGGADHWWPLLLCAGHLWILQW